MEIKEVEVYQVNGYIVCTKTEEDLTKYLSDVPLADYLVKSYLGKYFVIAIGSEFKQEKCKELRHMKINALYSTEEEAKLFKAARSLQSVS